MAARQANTVRAIAVVGPTGAGNGARTALTSAASGGPGSAPTAAGQSNEIGFSAIEFMGDRYVLIDSPGSLDFCAETDHALPAVDLAIVVADPDPDKALLLQPSMMRSSAARAARSLRQQDRPGPRPHQRAAGSAATGVLHAAGRAANPDLEGRKGLRLHRPRARALLRYQQGKPSEGVDIPATWPSAKPKRASTCWSRSPTSTTS